MSELFKKFLYASVGLVSSTTDKLRKTVDEMVEKGKMSEDEGKQIVDDFTKDTESKRKEFEDKLSNLVEDILHKLNLPTRSAIDALTERVEELEAAQKQAKRANAAKKVAPVAEETTTEA
jgi:polyhydroxyalkanoate synthesis regulator phasin